jgi:hypothetical protein
MSKITAVVGATGFLDDDVISALLQEGLWKFRGLTQNIERERAKALESQGVGIGKADSSDEESLVKAFNVSEMSSSAFNWCILTINSMEQPLSMA